MNLRKNLDSTTVTYPTNDPFETNKLKSKSSRREVPIPPPLMELLEKANPKYTSTVPLILHHKTEPKEEILLVGHVVHDAHGRTMTKSGYVKMWNKVKVTVSFDIVSHMLRHTYCTWLYDNGIDLKTAKDLMGHSDIKITDKIYTHIGEKQKNARIKIQSIFRKTGGEKKDNQ